MNERGNIRKLLPAVGAGFVVAAFLTAACCGIAAAMVNTQRIQDARVGYAVMLTLLLCSTVGAAVAAVKIPQMRFVVCMLSGGVYFAGLLCCGAILFDGAKSGVFPSLILIFAGSMAAYLLGMRGTRKVKYRLPKPRF